MIRTKTLLSILIAPLFFLVACDTSSPSAELTGEQTNIVKTASGEQIFQGIAFGEGPVAAALPEIYGNSSHQDAIKLALEDDVTSRAGERMNMSKEEVREALMQAKQVDPAELERISTSFMHQVTESISRANPTYFSRFKEQIRSGSHQKVQAALASMSPVIYPAISDVAGVPIDQLHRQEASSEKFIVVFVVVAVAVTVTAAVNVNAAANVNVAVNINEVSNVDPLEELQESASTKLKSERIVDLLVQRFATS